MNEVEKMYSNANIKICKRKQGFTLKDCTDRDCKECGYYDMPPFTAEKQIGIIKFLIGKYATFKKFRSYEQKDLYMVCYECRYFPKQYLSFEEALAESINHLWQDLTGAEKVQIKEILE